MNFKSLPSKKSARETLGLLFLSLCACVALSDVGNAGTSEVSSKITFENFPIEPITALAEQVAKQHQAEVKKPIYVVNIFRAEKTPIAAVGSIENLCVLVINKNPAGWAAWGEHFQGLNDKQRMAFASASLAREVENCKNPNLENKAGFQTKLELPKAVSRHLGAVTAKLSSTQGAENNGLFHSAIAMELKHPSPI